MKEKRTYHFAQRSLFAVFAVILLVVPSIMSAQSVARYSVTRSTGNTYNSINVSGTSVPNWRNTTGGNFNLDDNRSYQLDIGFDFWYRGVRYTQMCISTNGFIDFSSSTATGGPDGGAYSYQNTQFSATTGTLTSLAPFYDDLTTQGASDPLGEGIKYLVTGFAPNRVLTVEWINMAIYNNTTPDLNFQLKLYESSGEIEYNYSTMNTGTFSFTYTLGINGPTMSGTAAVDQLLVQQTANTTTFNNTETHTLATLPTAGSRLKFTPPAMNAPYNLTFTSISQTGMTLNWSDTLWNDVGFAVYASDDGGATYNFITQTAANATNYTMTGLLAGTTYYYKVYAVNEGRLSTALTGNQMTASAGSPYTITSGSWKNRAIWSTNSVPGISDNATIADGTVIYIDSTVTVNSLTVGQGTSGTLIIGNDNTARAITVIGNIEVKTGGIFRVNGASNSSTHTITSAGNIINSGKFVMAPDADSRCTVTFNKNGTQSINGNGDSTNFYLMSLNMGTSRSNILDVFATNFSVSTTNFLTITNGTFNLATGAAVTPFTAATTIPSSGGIRVNHSAATLTTTGGSITVSGEFRVQNGNVTIGNNTGHNLISSGGIFEFSGGTTVIDGGFIQSSAYVTTDFTMSGGTLLVADSGSTSTTFAPFNINTTGSIFTMSGGTIIIKKEGGGGTQDLGFTVSNITSYAVTGGTVQIGYSGLTPASQTMRITSSIPVYNLIVNSSNATAQLYTNNLTVLNNVTITAGTLNANALDITVGKDWSNSGTFTASTGKVTFNGTTSQSITDASGETFNKLFINKSGGTVTLANNVTVSDSFALSAGTFDVSTSTLLLNGVVTNGGTLLCSATGTVNYNKGSAVQYVFESNYGNLTFSNFTKVLPSATIGIAAVFTPGTAVGHTITGTTIDFNGAGAQNIPSFQYNNLTVSNGGTKTQLAGADTILGVLTIGASNTLAISSSDTLRLFGNIVNAGSVTGSNYLELRGSALQSMTGGGSYSNVKINNANGITFSGNSSISGTLRLFTGVISTGTDTLFITSSGTVSRLSGHINGWLNKNVATGSSVSRTFELGDAAAANYTPATFVFGTVNTAGNISVTTVATEHPDNNSSYIDPTNNVNRYWKSINSGTFAYTIGTGYSATFTFLNSGDLDQTGSETTFRVNLNNSIRWDSTTAGTRTTTTTQATGIDSLGDYVIGVQVVSGMYRSNVTTGNWGTAASWQRFNGTSWVTAVAAPSSVDGLITIRSGHTITVAAGVTIDQTIIEEGGQLTVNGGILTLAAVNNALVVNGTLRLAANSISGATAPRLIFNGGSLYQHAVNGGTIPTATWNDNSTCEVTGMVATTPGGTAQTFSNLKWNSSGQTGNAALNGALPTINGNLEVNATNSGQLQLTSAVAAMTINKNFIVTGGTVVCKTAGTNNLIISGIDTMNVSGGTLILRDNGASQTVTMNVANAVIVSNGTVNMTQRANVAGVGTINLSGDLRLTGGTLTETGTAYGQFTLNGTSEQYYSSGSTISNDIRFVVNSGAILSMGTAVLSGNQFTLSSGGTLKIGSTGGIASSGATGNIQTTTRSYNSGANYIYNGSAAQILGVFTTTATARTVNRLEIDNPAGVALSDSVTVTDSLKLLNGVLDVSTYTLYIPNIAYLTNGSISSSATGTVNYNKSTNSQSILTGNYGNLILSNFNKTFPAATIGIAGTFTPGTATGHTVTGNTINFNGTTAQSVNSWSYYNNLTISGSNWKQLVGNATVNGNLAISGGTLSDSIYTLTVKGNIANSTLNTSSGTGKTILTSGTSSHLLSGGGTYRILELSDSYGATASSDVIIDSVLTFTSGVLSSGTNVIICNVVPGIARTSGHINGILRKSISVSGTPISYTYQIGDATNYTPVDVTFQSVTVGGSLSVKQTAVDHPQVKYSGLDGYKSVNRYYTITNSGITFTTSDVIFNFVSGDVDAGANTAYFFVKRYNASWFPSTINVRNSTSTKTTGITGFGEFAIGEASNLFYWTKGAGTYNWGDDYNWSSHSVPTSGNDVVFDGKDTIEVNVNGVCNNLILQNDTLRLTILAGKTLTVSGYMTQYSGIFSTRAGFPTVAGLTSLSGGTFGYDSSGGTQSVAAQSYQHLRISGGGTKTAAGTFTVNKNLTISSGAIFADGGNTITVKDSVTVNGSHTGSGKILFDGTTQHQLTGAGSLMNLQLNNSSNGIALDSNITINGTLTLSSGIITAPSDTLYISSTGAIVRTSGHVNGNLRKYFSPASDSLTFEIGNASTYIPTVVSFGTISTGGNLTVQMTATEHPDVANSSVNSDSSINRYWIVKNNGIAFDSYNITFNWISGDVDAGISDFSDLIIAKKDNGVWDEISSGVITSTSIRGMNGTSFSEFAVGKASSQTFTSIVTGNWSTAATWDINKIPKRRDKVIIASPTVVTLTGDSKISRMQINSGGQFADAGYTLDLYGNLIFNGGWSGTGRIRWNDNVTDTLSGSGGKVSGTSTLFINGNSKLVTATNDTLYRIQIATGNSITNNGTIRTTRLIGDAAGSTWINAASSSLNVGDTLLTTGTLTATANGNTVIYNGIGAQSIKGTNYYNLIFGGGRTTNSITLPSSTISIAGALTSSATFTSGSFIKTGNTIDYNGSGVQTIYPFDYNNLTVSGARGGATVTLGNSDTIAVAGTFSLTATSVSYSNTGSIVDFNGTGAQSIPAFNYNKLRISGSRTTNSITLASSDTIGVADSLNLAATFSSGGYVSTGSKIAYNGTGAQTIVPFAYNNLSISGSRSANNVLFSSSDTIKIAGTFAMSASFSGGSLVFNGSTVDFNGTLSQTVPAFNYYNLRISGARTTNNVTVAPSTLGVANNFVPAASFSSGDYVTTSNTINFNGSGSQTIPAFRYNNLQTATGGTKTAGGTLRVAGDFTIGASTTFDASATTDTIYGNWTRTGTFTPSTSKIVFAGTPATTISGATTFNDVVANKLDSTTAISLSNNIQVVNLTMTKGTMQTGSNAVTITNTRTGNGIIIGTVTRTHTFSLSTAYAFEGPNSTITFTAGTTPSSVTMSVAQSSPASPTFVAVNRAVNITMTGGSGLTSILRLHYENSDANSLNETIMKLWQYSSSWINRSVSAYDSVNNYIEVSGLVSSLTGNWGIGSSASLKTVSDINGGITNAGDSLLYTISVTNPYNVTKSTIVVTDPLDNNLIIKSGTISNSGGIAGQSNNGNGSMIGGTISWPSFSLASGASTSRTFKVNTDSLMDVSEAIVNTGHIDFGGSQTENVSVSITITNIANISIDTNVVSNQTPVPGDTLIYTLKYTNSGTSNATSVSLLYTIPANTTFITNGYGAGTGIQVNNVAKTNVSDADEVTVTGSNISVSFASLTPGTSKYVKFKTIVN